LETFIFQSLRTSRTLFRESKSDLKDSFIRLDQPHLIESSFPGVKLLLDYDLLQLSMLSKSPHIYSEETLMHSERSKNILMLNYDFLSDNNSFKMFESLTQETVIPPESLRSNWFDSKQQESVISPEFLKSNSRRKKNHGNQIPDYPDPSFEDDLLDELLDYYYYDYDFVPSMKNLERYYKDYYYNKREKSKLSRKKKRRKTTNENSTKRKKKQRKRIKDQTYYRNLIQQLENEFEDDYDYDFEYDFDVSPRKERKPENVNSVLNKVHNRKTSPPPTTRTSIPPKFSLAPSLLSNQIFGNIFDQHNFDGFFKENHLNQNPPKTRLDSNVRERAPPFVFRPTLEVTSTTQSSFQQQHNVDEDGSKNVAEPPKQMIVTEVFPNKIKAQIDAQKEEMNNIFESKTKPKVESEWTFHKGPEIVNNSETIEILTKHENASLPSLVKDEDAFKAYSLLVDWVNKYTLTLQNSSERVTKIQNSSEKVTKIKPNNDDAAFLNHKPKVENATEKISDKVTKRPSLMSRFFKRFPTFQLHPKPPFPIVPNRIQSKEGKTRSVQGKLVYFRKKIPPPPPRPHPYRPPTTTTTTTTTSTTTTTTTTTRPRTFYRDFYDLYDDEDDLKERLSALRSKLRHRYRIRTKAKRRKNKGPRKVY
jgi:hypothetical protein